MKTPDQFREKAVQLCIIKSPCEVYSSGHHHDCQVTRIEQALLEVREETIHLCADTASRHRAGDSEYMWKSCSAEIREAILALLKTTDKEGSK